MNLENNLFYYASSELSQDAFICWLASFVLEDNDPSNPLCECAKKMIEMFVDDLKGQSFILKNIQHQIKKIDVLLTVKTNTQIYKIVVEDKVFTEEHNNQLKRYLNTISENNDYIVRGVYYKTGFQSDLSNVYDAKYKYISLNDMLNLLKEYVNITDNQIFKDYYNYWNAYLEEAMKYKIIEPPKWNDKQCYCFFDTLQKKKLFEWIGYGYVSNPRGGFQGLWFAKNDNKFSYNEETFSLYLQVESTLKEDNSRTYPIRLKVRFEKSQSSYDQLLLHIKQKISFENYSFKKTKQSHNGKTRTIAEYCEKSGTDAENLQKVLLAAYNNYSKILDQLKK